MIDDQEIHNEHLVQSSTKESGMDILAITKHLKTIWNNKVKIIRATLLFMLIGFFLAIFTPKKYTASTIIVPQTNDRSKVGGSLGGLAALAGINLGGMSSGESEISPTLYPQILSSISFQKELLKTPLTINGIKEKVTYEKYYLEIHKPGLLSTIKKYTIGLPSLILSFFKEKKETSSSNYITDTETKIFSVTAEGKQLIKNLQGDISLNVNKKDGYILISSTMSEPIAAAELTLKTQELLQKYVIDFKINKSKEQLTFIKERYLEKETEFNVIQAKLASYKDQNQFSNSLRSQTILIQFQTEYDLAFEVYSELAKQLEAQQIKVKEDTPVFTILQPVVIPIDKSEPNKIIILISWTFLGFMFGVGKIFVSQFLNSIRNSWHAYKV
jgi:LPS O-antigen subunit length determinant protein (WzzB/FepE family)